MAEAAPPSPLTRKLSRREMLRLMFAGAGMVGAADLTNEHYQTGGPCDAPQADAAPGVAPTAEELALLARAKDTCFVATAADHFAVDADAKLSEFFVDSDRKPLARRDDTDEEVFHVRDQDDPARERRFRMLHRAHESSTQFKAVTFVEESANGTPLVDASGLPELRMHFIGMVDIGKEWFNLQSLTKGTNPQSNDVQPFVDASIAAYQKQYPQHAASDAEAKALTGHTVHVSGHSLGSPNAAEAWRYLIDEKGASATLVTQEEFGLGVGLRNATKQRMQHRNYATEKEAFDSFSPLKTVQSMRRDVSVVEAFPFHDPQDNGVAGLEWRIPTDPALKEITDIASMGASFDQHRITVTNAHLYRNPESPRLNGRHTAISAACGQFTIQDMDEDLHAQREALLHAAALTART